MEEKEDKCIYEASAGFKIEPSFDKLYSLSTKEDKAYVFTHIMILIRVLFLELLLEMPLVQSLNSYQRFIRKELNMP